MITFHFELFGFVYNIAHCLQDYVAAVVVVISVITVII